MPQKVIAELRNKVFDHTNYPDIPLGGYVKFVDVLGSDKAIASTARLTAGTIDERLLAAKAAEDDARLIRRLMRDVHTSPFEFCEVVVKLRLPMDTWRQMVRHRTANVNEYSTRYSPAIDDTSKVIPGEWRQQSSSNRQGSSGYLDCWPDKLVNEFTAYLADDKTEAGPVCELQYPDRLNCVFVERLRHGLSINPRILRNGELEYEDNSKVSKLKGCSFFGSTSIDLDDCNIVYSLWCCFLETKGLVVRINQADTDYSTPQTCLTAIEQNSHYDSRAFYNFMLDVGVAREQARRDLPLSTFTEVVWKCDLHNICHFLKLRMASEAQLEVRAYAGVLADIVKTLFPVTYQAFEDYRLNAVTLSRMEFENLIATLGGLINQTDLPKRLIGSVPLQTEESLTSFLQSVLVPQANEITNKSELSSYLNKFRSLMHELKITG